MQPPKRVGPQQSHLDAQQNEIACMNAASGALKTKQCGVDEVLHFFILRL
jgi:hypothetical protein